MYRRFYEWHKKWTRKIHNGEHRRANNCSKRHWKNQQSKNRDVGCKTRKEKCKEKQLHGNKDEKKNETHENTWTWLRKIDLNRKTQSLITVAQDDAIRTNYIIAKINKTQLYSKYRLYGWRNETINHISECTKRPKEYQKRHDYGRQYAGNYANNRILNTQTNGTSTNRQHYLETEVTESYER